MEAAEAAAAVETPRRKSEPAFLVCEHDRLRVVVGGEREILAAGEMEMTRRRHWATLGCGKVAVRYMKRT